MARVESSVFSPAMISSSGVTSTGLKTWKPTRRSGCLRSRPISVMDSEEVLVARIASSRITGSHWAKTWRLTSISSKTASITKSASARSSGLFAPVISAPSCCAFSSLMRPFWAWARKRSRVRCTPASRRSSSRSVITTGMPAPCASRDASWPAIRPAPITAAFRISRTGASGTLAACLLRALTSSNAYRDARAGSDCTISLNTSTAAAPLASRDSVRARPTSSMAATGPGAAPCQAFSAFAAAFSTAASQVWASSAVRRGSCLPSRASTTQFCQDVSHSSVPGAPSSTASTSPISAALAGLRFLPLMESVTITFSAASAPTRCGSR